MSKTCLPSGTANQGIRVPLMPRPLADMTCTPAGRLSRVCEMSRRAVYMLPEVEQKYYGIVAAVLDAPIPI